MFDFTKAKEGFSDAENFLKQEYLQISTGRANPALLDGVNVESYGSFQPIKNIASINLEDARTMKVSPWDKGQIKDIEKAIVDSNLPFSLSVDDSGVRVHIPQMTEESKTKILRLVKDKLEDARIRVRNVRQDVMKLIDAGESNGDYSEDAKNNYKDDLQKMVDTANKNLEDIYANKEKDIMSV
ncbi:MAG: ribosome recycling factor [Candidatus Pacebacteria bacterium]|nr:ribosome recycling factor [Candidatus Paceibacterota bacterium]